MRKRKLVKRHALTNQRTIVLKTALQLYSPLINNKSSTSSASAGPVPAPKGLSQLLMVSTAHIHWDPALPDVKLVQTMMLVEELQKFVREASMQFRPNAPPPSMDAADLCNSMPLILCGDFNSLPDSGKLPNGAGSLQLSQFFARRIDVVWTFGSMAV